MFSDMIFALTATPGFIQNDHITLTEEVKSTLQLQWSSYRQTTRCKNVRTG